LAATRFDVMDSSPPTATGETEPQPAPQDFTSLFCEQYHCAPSEFEERALRVCLYWRARILAPLIRLIWPNYFGRDLELIRYLAKTPGRRDAMNELSAFMEADKARGGFARKMLYIRIAPQKTSRLIGLLFDRRAKRENPGAAPRNAS